MMKRCAGTTSHTGVRITKDASNELICHAGSWLLWRRCIKCGTLLVAAKPRVKPHVRSASIGSKRLRWIKAFIASISLLKWSRRVALPFFKSRRGRGLVGIECFLDLLHILLKLLAGFPLLMKPSLNGMVRATHAKQKPEHFLQRGGGFSRCYPEDCPYSLLSV
jgi:hypothetical protein